MLSSHVWERKGNEPEGGFFCERGREGKRKGRGGVGGAEISLVKERRVLIRAEDCKRPRIDRSPRPRCVEAKRGATDVSFQTDDESEEDERDQDGGGDSLFSPLSPALLEPVPLPFLRGDRLPERPYLLQSRPGR